MKFKLPNNRRNFLSCPKKDAPLTMPLAETSSGETSPTALKLIWKQHTIFKVPRGHQDVCVAIHDTLHSSSFSIEV